MLTDHGFLIRWLNYSLIRAAISFNIYSLIYLSITITTICLRSKDPSYVVTYYIKWVTSTTYSRITWKVSNLIFFCRIWTFSSMHALSVNHLINEPFDRIRMINGNHILCTFFGLGKIFKKYKCSYNYTSNVPTGQILALNFNALLDLASKQPKAWLF